MESGNLKTISELEKKVKKYELKMRDLIEAYKCVIKEKETLEKTVESFSRQKKFGNNVEGSTEVDRLQGELATLSTSIASLTEERRRMERSYLEDKRVMRAEYESNLKAIRSELETQSIINEKLRTKLKTEVLNMEKVDENLIERDYQVTVLNDECARLRVELSAIQHQMTVDKNGHELRVAQLEETLAEISKNIGQMEKQHLNDSDIIVKLTDRVQSLLSESRSATKSRESQSDTPDILQFQELEKGSPTTTIKAIVERMSRLREQLQDIDPHLDLVSIIAGDDSKAVCGGVCRAEIGRLTDELECAELKLESALRSRSCSTYPSYQQQELDRVNEELLATRARVTDLQEELSTMDSVATRKERALRDSVTKMERTHRQEVAKMRQEHGQTTSELQSELTKHRNRTINLLSEKDTEIQSLQRIVQTKACRALASDDQGDSYIDQCGDPTDLLTSSKFDSSCPLYQCCETKARMDQELRRLRQQKRQLEMSVHKLEADTEYHRSDWTNELCTLRDKLQQAESIGQLGTSINMEYLRNVFLRFLTSSDSSCKYLMAKAIGKVLQLSAKELSTVDKSFQV